MRYLSRTLAGFLFLAVTLAWTQSSTLQPQSAKPAHSVPIPLAVIIPTPPTVFHANHQQVLCYEIYLNNLSSTPWTVLRLDVTNENRGFLQSVEAAGLDNVIFHPNRPHEDKGGPSAEIAPGESVVIYMWVMLAQEAPVPVHLQHRFALKRAADDKTYQLDAPATSVIAKLPHIASPLRGDNWLAANGPSNTSQHRRALIVVDGTPHIAQRYAIDWVKIDASALTYHGDAKDNRNYYCFGVDALAVADGTVVEMKDGIPENTPGAPTTAVPITLETVAGNHVNLDLGGGVYAMYAHLQPGSIRVKLGDQVKVGQVIGLVGNTGNSSEPHLHFQLMDANSPLGSEGLPYTLPPYKLTGHETDDEKKPTVHSLPSPETPPADLPLENDVVNF